jgi:P pilus assembly chaperone PapD
MPKQIIIDQIEVSNNGTVHVRMHKLSSDGDLIGNHRTSLPPATDINAQVGAVNEHMATENYTAISDADVAKLTAICNTAWTAEVIAAYQAAQAAAEAARNSA